MPRPSVQNHVPTRRWAFLGAIVGAYVKHVCQTLPLPCSLASQTQADHEATCEESDVCAGRADGVYAATATSEDPFRRFGR
jgi:hypothetical protein